MRGFLWDPQGPYILQLCMGPSYFWGIWPLLTPPPYFAHCVQVLCNLRFCFTHLQTEKLVRKSSKTMTNLWQSSRNNSEGSKPDDQNFHFGGSCATPMSSSNMANWDIIGILTGCCNEQILIMIMKWWWWSRHCNNIPQLITRDPLCLMSLSILNVDILSYYTVLVA